MVFELDVASLQVGRSIVLSDSVVQQGTHLQHLGYGILPYFKSGVDKFDSAGVRHRLMAST